MRFLGKSAVVTGSSRGIGFAIAEQLAAEGARLVLHGLDAQEVAHAESQIRASGREVVSMAGDLGLSEEATQLFDEAERIYGHVDILVNNAAWANPQCHFLEMSERHWDTVIRTNLKSVFLCSQLAARSMLRNGSGGCILSIGSFSAARAHRMMAAYDAAKGAIEALSRAIALDLAPFGVRANVVAPGPIQTAAFDAVDPVIRDDRIQSIPLGRIGLPIDVAHAIAFLASDDAAFITGQVLYVDGGVLAQLRSPQIDTPLPSQIAEYLKIRQ